ncbi:MAG: hypothetical protein JSV15_02635 [Candidatus Bathyarchaeota archaeon]|nr:MAG: hypothetical protein JSV15_02635 [Candidatus Bathyarchaeota archaeon]
MKEKIKVYVSSFEISTLDYVDQHSIGHPCVTSHHSKNVFTEFKHLPEKSWDGYLTDDQMKAVVIVSEFCQQNGLEYEVVDMRNTGFASKMKLMFKGIAAPTISFRGKKIEGIPTKENLETLISK